MSFRWLRVLPVVVLVLVGLLSGGSAVAQDASPEASPAGGGTGLEGATAWLQSLQAEDGGFVGYTGESDPGFTLDVLMALGAARNAGIDTTASIDAAVAYLGEGDHALVYTQTGVGQASKLILGLLAVGVEPEGFASVMPLTVIQNGAADDTGIYGTGIFDHSLAILALVALGEEVPAEAIDALAATQSAIGGWAWDASTDDATSDSNTTSMVVQALVAAGHGDSDLVVRAMGFLDSVWTDGGGTYDLTEGAIPDSNSTALVIQARLAVGGDVSDQQATLLSFQSASGALFFNESDTTDSAYSVTQAIPVLAGQAFPVLAAGTAMPVATPVSWTHSIAA